MEQRLRLRSPKLSDAMAGTYWNTFLGLVAFVDKRDDDAGLARKSKFLSTSQLRIWTRTSTISVRR